MSRRHNMCKIPSVVLIDEYCELACISTVFTLRIIPLHVHYCSFIKLNVLYSFVIWNEFLSFLTSILFRITQKSNMNLLAIAVGLKQKGSVDKIVKKVRRHFNILLCDNFILFQLLDWNIYSYPLAVYTVQFCRDAFPLW